MKSAFFCRNRAIISGIAVAFSEESIPQKEIGNGLQEKDSRVSILNKIQKGSEPTCEDNLEQDLENGLNMMGVKEEEKMQGEIERVFCINEERTGKKYFK